MITGFNTDIEFGGVTYHVQTEDKGISTPIILSLVYDRGTILASKRSPYDDLLTGEFDETLLVERLQKQHKLICAAVQAGRIEDLKEMTARSSDAAKKQRAKNSAAATGSAKLSSKSSKKNIKFEADISEAESPIPKPFFDTGTETLPYLMDELMIDDDLDIDEETIIPENAVEIVEDFADSGRPANNKLSIQILGETEFKGGETKTLGFMVCRGSQQKVVGDAEIMVKIIGSSFRPLVFHASTDGNGLATVNFQLPSFRTGRAAFLVRAMSNGEEIELRRPIADG